MDVDAVERVEAELGSFILKRAWEREDAHRTEELWVESARRHAEKRRRENRAAWRAFHLCQAECIERTAAELAANHRARAQKYTDDSPKGALDDRSTTS